MPIRPTPTRSATRSAAYLAAALVTWAALGGCAKKPDGEGVCQLDCGQAIIAGNEAVFTLRATTTNIPLQCGTPGNFQRPIEAKFQVSQNTGTAEAPRLTPVPFISVAPAVYGDLAPVNNPNPEAIYQGILTPKSEWCSDACGVVTLQVLPLCPAAGRTTQTTIAVSSGALSSDRNFVFSVESK